MLNAPDRWNGRPLPPVYPLGRLLLTLLISVPVPAAHAADPDDAAALAARLYVLTAGFDGSPAAAPALYRFQ